jgi:hypothetical protein
MPGAIVVPIKRGQTVFWNGDGLHRGRTTAGVHRLSLACGWAGPPPGGWAGIDEHGFPDEKRDQSQSGLIQWKFNRNVRVGINPIVTLKKQLLDTIGNLV